MILRTINPNRKNLKARHQGTKQTQSDQCNRRNFVVLASKEHSLKRKLKREIEQIAIYFVSNEIGLELNCEIMSDCKTQKKCN